MIYPATVTTDDELKQILQLQQENLPANITQDELQGQGFVTVHHSFDVLKQMHGLSPSVIVKDDDKVIAYALVMLKECRNLVPVLVPMFNEFDKAQYNNRPISQYKYYIIGQICVSKAYRGKGIFEMLYEKHRELFSRKYDFVLTEVSVRNQRSLRAHAKTGFKTIHRYKDATDDWEVILWDWKNNE
jgi:ribosomal protein S18 acetylase RimI-like enzyme